MELTHQFIVPVPPDEAWRVLTDIETIAPCLPGAQLQEIEGDEYRGIVKVKVGPITAQYQGKATFQVKDDEARRAVLVAEGRETRGQGNASATITAVVTADGDGAAVSVVTDLDIKGRVAQFGRGALADVTSKLLDQFVACLESDVLSGEKPVVDPVAARVAEAASHPAAKRAVEAANGAAAAAEAEAAAGAGHSTRSGAATASTNPEAMASPESRDGAAEPVASAKPEIRQLDQPEAQPVDLLDTAGAPLAKRLLPIITGLVVVLLIRRLRAAGA